MAKEPGEGEMLSLTPQRSNEEANIMFMASNLQSVMAAQKVMLDNMTRMPVVINGWHTYSRLDD